MIKLVVALMYFNHSVQNRAVETLPCSMKTASSKTRNCQNLCVFLAKTTDLGTFH